MPKPCNHDSHEAYDRLIGPLRERAKELGYALGVHGTLKRDIDLIACPWTEHAVDAAELAEALLRVAGETHGIAFLSPHEDDAWHRAGVPGLKAHGRLCWSFHLGGGPYVDLSVMPRTEPAHPLWLMRDDGTWEPIGDAPARQFAGIGVTSQFRPAPHEPEARP